MCLITTDSLFTVRERRKVEHPCSSASPEPNTLATWEDLLPACLCSGGKKRLHLQPYFHAASSRRPLYRKIRTECIEHETRPSPRRRSIFAKQISDFEGVSIVGDACDSANLRLAGIDQAAAIAIVKPNDLVNLQIGMLARRMQPSTHLVLHVLSDLLTVRLEDLFRTPTIYSTPALAAPTLAA